MWLWAAFIAFILLLLTLDLGVLHRILPAGPDTVHYTLGAVTVILMGGAIASLIRARRSPESCHVEIPARRKLVKRGHR
jgi:peptidoglycan/LPS O-acetylase OafA/YrhL